MLRILLATALFIVPQVVLKAQEVISISDPTVNFSFKLPEEAKYEDNGLYLKVFPTEDDSNAYVSITYFKDDGKVNLDTAFYIQEEFSLPNQKLDFKALAKGKANMCKYDALWLKYSFTNNQLLPADAVLYMSDQVGQRVFAECVSIRGKMDGLLPACKKIVRSICIETKP